MRSKHYVLVTLLAMLSGCQTVKVDKPLTQTVGGNDLASQGEFWHSIARRGVVSHDEAFHGLLSFVDGEDRFATYEQRVAELKRRGILPDGFHASAEDATDRGTLAVALVNAMGWKGGFNRAMAGNSPRYAFRTLQFKGVYPGGSPNQLFSGAEFLGIMGKVEDLRRGGKTDLPANELPPPFDDGTEVVNAMLPTREEIVSEAVQESIGPLPFRNRTIQFTPSFWWMGLAGMISQGTPAPRPATTRPGPAIRITGVQGKQAQVRLADDGMWEPAGVGMVLPVGAHLRTGIGSTIRLEIAPDQTLTLDRFGTMRIVEANREAGRMTTDVETAYGRVRYNLEALPQHPIEGAGVEHSSTIRAPNSTLAVRGTRVILFDQPPYVPTGVSLTGRAYYTNAKGQFIAFGGRGNGLTRIRRSDTSAAETALAESVVDPSVGYARSQDEAALVAALISRGAVVFYDRGRGINVVRGGSVPGRQEARALAPGRLKFVLTWTGNANLDLAVVNQRNEVLVPAPGLTKTPSGGRIAFDHQGGKAGGVEVSYWPTNSFPGGLSAFAISHVSGGPAAATLEVFVNDKPQRIFLQDNSCTRLFSKDMLPGDAPAAAQVPLKGTFVPCQPFNAPTVATSRTKRFDARNSVKPTAAKPTSRKK